MSEFRPILFCLCGPTASGKTTICRELTRCLDRLKLSVSTTTRLPRSGEREGEDYFFVSDNEFNRRVEQGCFLEHAEFGGKRYGTEKRNMELSRESSCDLLFDIEVQGVVQLKKLFADDVVTVFVFPKSFAVLKKRLKSRGAESEEEMERRLEIASRELALLSDPSFSNYFIINDALEASYTAAKSIIRAERAKMLRVDQDILTNILK